MLYWITFATGLIGVNVITFLTLLWCLRPWVKAARRRRVLAWMAVVFLILNLPLAVFFFRPLDMFLMTFPAAVMEMLFLPSAAWVTALLLYSLLVSCAAAGWAAWSLWQKLLRYRTSTRHPLPKVEAPTMAMSMPADVTVNEPAPVAVWPERRKFIAGGVWLALPALYGVSVYGLHGALDDLEVSPELPIPIPHLSAALDGLRVVQLSDIHVGPYLRRRELESLVVRVNALRPDIIAITGDLIDRDLASLPDTVAGLRGLRASQGIYMVLGNHDLFADRYSYTSQRRGGVEIAEAMVRIGVRTLRDESAMVGEGNDQLAVMGLDWIVPRRETGNLFYDETRTRTALQAMDARLAPETPKILLVHHPESFREVPGHQIGLTLAGHTHGGGQILLGDYGGQPVGLAMIRFKFTRGLYREGASSLYVSRGIGYLGVPIRLNCPPEICQFILTRAPSA
ncbi:MAG: metallophosphoesterase [Acidobacteria bacterium]|nr:metallophosphoesterase [Acidobacteriota bacterium]